MPKSSQTPFKAKSSSKTEAKPKNMNPKSKRSAKSSTEHASITAPSPPISSIVPSIKIKSTPRKPVKSDKVVIDDAAKVDTVVKEVVVHRESVSTTTSQVKLPPSKLDILVSTIDVSPIDIVPPTSDKPRVEETTVKTDIATQEKRVDTSNVMPMVEREGDKEPVNKEASDSLSFSGTEDDDDNEGEEEGGLVASHEEHQSQDMANDTDEKRGENKGESGDEKESEAEDKLDELVGDYGEEEKYNEEEVDYESEGEDEEKGSESEGKDEENENASGESEGSMAIENTVIAPSKKASGEKITEETEPLLTPFTGDEEVIRNEDNLPLSVVGKKRKKSSMKATKSVIPVRKEVALHARTPFTRSKRKVVDEQIIKKFRGAKKPGKQVPVIEPAFELDVEDESDSTLQEKTSA
ncbi:uncharacterized protein [Nicotiana tomentosiformis]|uniref:uncharacterized protein n=1 Tax=Nicotiana tomentosiformis TaxID=4098 RepID=UPI00388CB17D